MTIIHTNGIREKWVPRNKHAVLDKVRAMHRLRNDRELAEFLDMQQSVVCRIRSGQMEMSAAVILAVHEIAGIPIADIKAMLKALRP